MGVSDGKLDIIVVYIVRIFTSYCMLDDQQTEHEVIIYSAA